MATVIITGASGGLGKELARTFAEARYDLILQRRSTVQSLDYPEEIRKVRVDWVWGNLRLFTPLNEIVEVAEQRGATVLINNAAVHLNKSFDEMTDCDIKEVVETNLISPMILTRKLWAMLKKNNGLVININSLAGKEGGKGETAYCASKHGLAGFSKALQFDGTKDDVRVINVYIGKMNTKMTAGQVNQEKYIDSAEVANIILYLCQDFRSSRITDITIERRIY